MHYRKNTSRRTASCLCGILLRMCPFEERRDGVERFALAIQSDKRRPVRTRPQDRAAWRPGSEHYTAGAAG
jgi:hypothetical protein